MGVGVLTSFSRVLLDIEVFIWVWFNCIRNGKFGIVFWDQADEIRESEFQIAVLYSMGSEPTCMWLRAGAWLLECEEGPITEPC